MITPLQHKVFLFIQDYIGKNTYAPSLTEIAQGIGISPKSISLISRAVHALAKDGKITLVGKGYRNIQLHDKPTGVTLPILGKIAAGTPIEAIPNKESLDLQALFQEADYFALRVQGDSMIEEGIFSGDLVICRPAASAHEGEIVVALIDGQETTLKRISYKLKNYITLMPANPALKPKAYAPERIEIQAVFMGLVRLRG